MSDSDSDSDAPVDGEEEEDLECAGPLLPAGVRKRRHAIHNYFTYNKKSKKSKCKTGDCGVELSGKNTTNLINHLKKPSHKKDYAIYLQDVALSDKQQTSNCKGYMAYQGAGHSGNEESPSKEDASSDGPPRKKGRKHREKVSWVWQYFIEEGNFAICQFCEASLSTASTTTLKYHLNHLHKDLIAEGEPNLNQPKPRLQVVSIPSKSPLKNSVNVTKNPPLPKHFLKETTALISKMLGKPSSNIRVVQVIQDDEAGNIENRRKKHSPSSKDYSSAVSSNRNKTKKHREKVSWVWQHFRKEGNMATCEFCQASLSAASTTTLKYHLNHLHKDLLTNETSSNMDSTNPASQTEIIEIEPEIIMVPEIAKMPHLKITTNISKSSVPSDFLDETSALLSKMLDKPENCSIVTVVPERLMLWGGEKGPCAIARLRGVGKLGDSDNANLKVQLGEHIEKFLGVPPSRMLIHNDINTAYF